MQDQRFFRHILVVLAAACAGLLYGYDIGMIGPTLLQLGPAWALSDWQTALLASSHFAGSVVACFIASQVAERYGRRFALRCAAICYFAGVICALLANQYTLLLAGRRLQGLALGMASIVAALYLTEIVPAAWRGRAVGSFQLLITTGICLGILIGLTRLSAWWILASTIMPALLFAAASVVIPRSPRWLSRIQQRAAAEAILLKLCFTPEERHGLLNHTAKSKASTTLPTQKREWWALIIVVALACSQQLTGINAILQFDPIILHHAGGRILSANQLSCYVTITNVLITGLALCLIYRVGRRKLLLLGCGIICLAHLSLFVCWHMMPAGKPLAIVSMLGLALMVAGFALGPGAVMWVMMPELFPERIRTAGMAITVALSSLCVFILNSCFLTLSQHIGFAGIFLLFFCMGCASAAICWRKAHETCGRTLQELEEAHHIQG